jgi:hypothetical protein
MRSYIPRISLMLAKRLSWPWNATVTVPVEPFLCLARIRSASPARGILSHMRLRGATGLRRLRQPRSSRFRASRKVAVLSVRRPGGAGGRDQVRGLRGLAPRAADGLAVGRDHQPAAGLHRPGVQPGTGDPVEHIRADRAKARRTVDSSAGPISRRYDTAGHSLTSRLCRLPGRVSGRPRQIREQMPSERRKPA